MITMQLDELKNSMTVLEQVLAKTNADIRINVSASATAQRKILKKYRFGAISCLVLSAIFTASAIFNINPESFPQGLKIYLIVLLAIATIWYHLMYIDLRKVNIATMLPAQLFAKTARLKLLLMAGEAVFTVGMAVFFALVFPHAWVFHRFGFWAMSVALPLVILYSILRTWPAYIRLFRELNTIK